MLMKDNSRFPRKGEKLMYKKVIAVSILIIVLLTLSACGKEGVILSKEEETTQTTQNNPVSVPGVYVYELHEGDLAYNITRHNFTINDDGTFKEIFEWSSKELSQKTTGENGGTWKVEDKKLLLTNNAGITTTLEMEGDRLIQAVQLGFNSKNYAYVYFKKE